MTELALDNELWPGILGSSHTPPGTPVEPATEIIIGVPLQPKSLHTNRKLEAPSSATVLAFVRKDT